MDPLVYSDKDEGYVGFEAAVPHGLIFTKIPFAILGV